MAGNIGKIGQKKKMDNLDNNDSRWAIHHRSGVLS
jgi:hypothetical protein